jgi:hypothetical protein
MGSYEVLLAGIRAVRGKRRVQVLVKGLSLFLISAIALLVLGVWGADFGGFRPAAVWSMRVLAGGAVLFAAWYLLYLPLRGRVTDVQIAQFIEERYPQLEDRLVTAIEVGGQSPEAASMIDLLIRDALDKTSRLDFSIFVNRRRLASFVALGIFACIALVALLQWGPTFFPYGFSHLYVPWTEASLGASMMIKVTPGDVEIAKGGDQEIRAQLIGFDSLDVRLYMHSASSDQVSFQSMEPDPHGSSFRYLLIDIGSSLRYHVESKGVRSPVYSIDVKDLAKVDKLTLTYNFPAYTGMTSQTVENEGDISALKGTRIDLKIRLSRPAQSARLLFDNQSALELAGSGTQDFSGSFVLQRSGSYVVQAAEAYGRGNAASSEYGMEAIEDAPPKVTVTRPMRDVRATNVEEAFSEVRAEDDIGVGKLDLHYSVNGAPEKTVNLYGGPNPEHSVVGSHTFFLEEFGLQPGDLISYYGKASDKNNVTGPGVSSSDIYFIQIRPFEQKYVQNQQGAPPGAQGGEGQEALSRQQKDIISATFKLIRDKERMAQKEFTDNVKSLALVQSRLQQQAQGLVDRLQRRGAVQIDDNFRKLFEYLKNAIGEMGKATADLGAQNPGGALPDEQKSLQQLMRAESLFREIQVSFAAQSAGSGSQANAEDLADLFELELNKLKNQYETLQRGEQQAKDQKVDEALQRLKELAQRQQQLNERNRMLEQRGMPPSASAGGKSSQQQLMEEAELLRRQLQRLSRERSSPQLNEAGNQLEKAIEEMKKALQQPQSNKGAETRAEGLRALQQLNDAARKLARNQDANLNQGMAQAVDESAKLMEEQSKIQSDMNRLEKNDKSGNPSEAVRQEREDVAARKSLLAERLKGLEGQIRGLSKQARKAQPEAGGKLDEAANAIQDKKLADRISNGSALVRSGIYENQKQREDFIRGALEDVNKKLQSAQSSMGQSKEGKAEEASNRARQLSEGLESMQQRMSGMQEGSQRGQQQSRPQSRKEGSPNPQDIRGLGNNSQAPMIGTGRFQNEEERQLSREFEQRLTDAQELRRLLDRSSTQMENLDKVIDALRRAGNNTNAASPEQIARLKSAIDYMRQVEFDLAKDLDRLSQKDKSFFAEDNESPASYQKLVEEYFKAIAKTR